MGLGIQHTEGHVLLILDKGASVCFMSNHVHGILDFFFLQSEFFFQILQLKPGEYIW